MSDYVTKPMPEHPKKTIAKLFVSRNYAKLKYNLFQKHFSEEPQEIVKPIFENYVKATEIRDSAGKYEKAAKLVTKGAGKYQYLHVKGLYFSPEVISLANHLAEELAKKNDHFKAIGLLIKVTAHAHEDSKTILNQKICKYALSYVDRMTENPKKGLRYLVAEAMVRRVIQCMPEETSVRKLMADALLRRVKAYTNNPEDYLGYKVKSAIEKAVEYYPDRKGEFHNVMAEAFLNRAKHYTKDPTNYTGYSLAESAIEKAVEYAPNREEEFHNVMAEAFLNRAKHYNGEDSLSKSIAIAAMEKARAYTTD